MENEGILISDAALVVENAFRAVLGFNDDALAQLNPDQKFELYFSGQDRLDAIIDFIRSNKKGGLPSFVPPYTIEFKFVNDIGTGTKIGTLVSRVSKFAEPI